MGHEAPRRKYNVPYFPHSSMATFQKSHMASWGTARRIWSIRVAQILWLGKFQFPFPWKGPRDGRSISEESLGLCKPSYSRCVGKCAGKRGSSLRHELNAHMYQVNPTQSWGRCPRLLGGGCFRSCFYLLLRDPGNCRTLADITGWPSLHLVSPLDLKPWR